MCRVKKLLILALLAFGGAASAQRIGLYPLETTDATLALAVPTAVARVLEAVDGAILPTPIEMLQAVKRRAAFEGKLAEVFSLSTLITGKLEGTAGAYSVTYTLSTAGKTQSVTAKGADFQKLVVASDAALLTALGLKPSSTDLLEIKAIESQLPSAEVVAAAVVPSDVGSAAILEKGAQNPWALVGRALALIQAGKEAEALPLASAAAKLAPQDPTALVMLALVQLVGRNNTDARTTIDAGLKINPAKSEFHYLLGRYLLRATSPATEASVRLALASLERALQYNPRFLEAAVIDADLRERFGDLDGAYNVLARLVPKMPDEVALHNRVLDLLVANDRDQATAYLRSVINTYPDVPDTVYALAGRLFDTGVAVKITADGEIRYASSAALASTRGQLSERQTKYEDAVKAYKQALERDPKLQSAGLALAGALSKLGRFDEAEGAIQANFGRIDQKLLARMYLQTGRFDRAKTVLEKLAVTDAEIPYYLGVLALRQYQPDEAKKQLEAAIKLKPDDSRSKVTLTELPDARLLGAPKLTGTALYQLQLAQSLLDSGSPLEARAILEAALKSAPSDLHLNFYYGYTLSQVSDPDDAVEQFQATLKLAPNNVVVMSFLAASYIGQGRFDLAEAQAKAAIKLDAKYARGHLYLGLTYFALENAALAKDAFLKAVAANADFKILADPYITALSR